MCYLRIVELKTARFDLSTNLYRPIGNNIIDDKKVLQGWDITAKGHIPNYEQVSVGVGSYTFDGVGDTVVKGNKLIAEFTPNPVLTLRGEYDKPNGESAQTDISVDFKLAFGKSIQDQMKSASVSPSIDTAWHKRYDKVERKYDIKTAEVDTTPTLPVVTAATITSSSGKAVASGDGKTQATAFVLPDGNKFEIKKFIDAPTGAVKATQTDLLSRSTLSSRTATTPTVAVTVTVIRGTLGKEFTFEDSAGNAITNMDNVDYDSMLVDMAGSDMAVLKLSYAVTGFAPQDIFVKTSALFTDTLAMGDLVVPYASGDKDVSANDILAKLTITPKAGNSNTQTQASQWTIKSLANTDSHANLAIAADKKSMTISGAISTKTTVTVVLAHPQYDDVTETFELSTATGALNSGTHTGSGKWGQSYTTDYKLKTSDTVGDTTVTFDTNADFTFEIVAPATTVSGFTSTTTGIVQGALTGAINADTGAIDGTKLTKSGTLLVKIVRKAKGGLPQVTDYANLPVAKQTATDHTGFTVSASPIVWATASTAVTYTATNAPTDIGTATYTLTAAGTTAGNAITIASSTGAIAKTTQSGVVKVKVTYAANDKYAQMSRDVDVAVNKQSVPMSTLTAAKIIVPYTPDVSGTEVVSTTYILDELFTSSSAKSDWSIKSLADTDTAGSGKLAISADKKSMTIIEKIATPITITVVLESSKYVDMTRTFKLSTRAVQVIDGTPTGLSGKWGKSTVTPDYKLDLTDQGQTFVKATDYTFSVVPSSDGGKGGKDATTAGIFSSNPISNARTGAIDTSKLTKSGKLLIKIVRAAKGSGANAVAAATEYVNFDVTKQVLGTDVTAAPAVATATGEQGKWKDSTSTKINLAYTLPGGTTASDYTWAVGKKSGAEPSGTLAIDSSGDISGATSSGTAEITITAKGSNGKYSGSIRTGDFAIGKQVLGTDVTTRPAVATATGEDGKWKTSTSAKIALNYTLPGGTTASDYSWAVGKKSGAEPSGTLVADGNGHISGATSSGTAEITITAKAANKKYSGSIRTGDFAIKKQAAMGTLSVRNLVIAYSSGDKAVSTADIESQLSVTGTQKSDWKLKSLADTDTIGASTLVIAGDKKRLTIKKQITTPTTITAVFESNKYEDKSDTFELSTRLSQVIDGTPTGVSAKWGKGTVTPDYKLKNRDAGQPFDKATDYTFSVVAAGTTVNGFTSTTANIFTSNPISNAKTGGIDTSKLTQSGTLLMKIVRAAKGSGAGAVAAATEYVNFTVNKQVFGTGANADVKTVPTVSLANGDDTKWKTSTATKFDMAYTTLPFRLSADDFTWEVAGKSGSAPSGSLAIDKDGKISGATSAGTVVITIKAKSDDDKYEGQFTLADFAITKQKTTDTLSAANLVIPYGSGTVPVNVAAILGKLSVTSTGTAQTQKSDWQIKSVADTDSHGKLAVANDGKSLSISGVIGPSTTVTVVYEDKNNKYADETKTFELSTGAGTLSTATRTGSGKWGKTFTTDYKLKTSDTVGDVSATFNLNTDYTFSIVAPATTVTGFTSTTNGIVNGALTGAIGIRNGAIDGTKLTKSGKLLVKIVRAAKSGLPALTTYQNFDVHKQTAADHTGFSVSAGAITWNTNSQTVTYTENASKPTGIGTATYALTRTGTTAGATTGGNAITVASSNGKIAKTTQSGVVKVKITYAANDKYESMTRDVDVSVNKQTVANNTLSVANLVVTYVSGDKVVSATDVLGQLTATSSTKSDWTVKSLANTDSHADVAVTDRGKSLTISGGITTTTTTITVVFESTKYTDVTKTFELSTTAIPLQMVPVGATNPPTKPWGSAITKADYKLPRQVGGVSHNNLQYTFKVTGSTVGGITSSTTLTDGAIAANTTTDSGTINVEITRAAIPNQLAKATQTVTIPVGKKNVATDVTKPTVTSTNAKWKTGGGKIPLSFSGLPSGTTFGDYTWTVAGKTAATTPTGNMSVASDGLIGATSSGMVTLTMKAKSNDDKYSGSVALGDLTIAKQDAPWVVNPKYASATEALKAANRLTKDTDASMILHGGTADFALRGPIANDKVTVTPITNISDITNQDNTITAAVIDTTATENIKFQISGSPPVTLTGTAGAIITAMQKELQSDKLVGIRKVSDNRAHKDKALKLRIQVPADKKYTAFDETLYFVTSSTTKAIGTQPVGATPTLPARVWGSAITHADYNLPTSIKVGGQTYNSLTYTFEVIASTVISIGVGDKTNFDTRTGAIAADKTSHAGTITVKITRAAIPGEVAQATQTVTIPVTKKTLPPPPPPPPQQFPIRRM